MASERIKTMCDHFEETIQIVEFVQAINQFFESVNILFKTTIGNFLGLA